MLSNMFPPSQIRVVSTALLLAGLTALFVQLSSATAFGSEMPPVAVCELDEEIGGEKHFDGAVVLTAFLAYTCIDGSCCLVKTEAGLEIADGSSFQTHSRGPPALML